jgi:hypothetical protein
MLFTTVIVEIAHQRSQVPLPDRIYHPGSGLPVHHTHRRLGGEYDNGLALGRAEVAA